MNKSFTLKDQYQSFLQENIHISDWLTEDILYGIWYFNLDNTEEFYINSSFWKTLNFPITQQLKESNDFLNIFVGDQKKKIMEQISLILNSSEENFESIFYFRDYNGEDISLNATSILIKSTDGSKNGIIVKFTKIETLTSNLMRDVNLLKKLQTIYNQTNEIARVGGWEVDLITGTITWTKVTKEIHEVDLTFEPDMTTGINFYKEGHYRELVTKLVNEAIENGTEFDAEFKIITAKNNEIWVRSFGKAEFEDGNCVRIYGAFQDIDQKKKQELQFKQTNERFEKIFTNSSLGLLLVDRENRPILINNSFYRIFGLEHKLHDDYLNATFKDLMHPEDLDETILFRKRLLTGRLNNYKHKVRFYLPCGKKLWCTVETSLLKGHGPSEDLIITQIEDITERMELERVALENSSKFMNAFEYSPNGMGVVSIKGEWLLVNKNLSQMIGYSKNELLHLRSKDITHNEDLYNDTEFLRELLKKERESYSIKKRYIHKSGKIVYGFLTVSLLTDNNGKPTSLIGQVVDITETLKSEQKLKHTLRDLQNLLAATTHVSIIETDLNGVARKFNKGAENLLGYSAEEVVGSVNVGILHDPAEVAIKGLELSEEYNKKIEGFDVFIHKANLGEFDSSEWSYIRKDGTRFSVQLVVTAIRNSENEITGYLGVATDISQLKEMEISLVTAKLKAEAANRSKSEFLANMSHEIRTPLNGVIGFTDLLMQTELSTSQNKYMHTVYNSANALLDLLNDILDFSKIEAGKLEINKERTDLIQLCGQTIDIIRHQAHSKGLEVLLNIPANTKRLIHADSVRLRQILTNLLGNAVKFTKTGEIELKIRTESDPLDENKTIYQFSIRDTGIGIAPKNMDKIFYAFDQEDGSTTRKYGGTGLGLTISNKLLQLMESKLNVQSKLGYGSTFSFDVSFETEDQENHGTGKLKTIKNVMIIDDNDNNRTILKEMLAVDDINSTPFTNGIEAIEFLENENPFDLAIIDYHMPYLNGLDLIKHLRLKMGLTSKKLPIILLHSSGDDEKIIKICKDLDVQSNVVKPIQIHKLFNLIEELQKPKEVSFQEVVIEVETDLSHFDGQILVAEDNPVNKFLSKTILNKLLPNAIIHEANDGLEAVRLFEIKKIDLIFMDIQMPNMSGYEATTQIRLLEENGQRVPIIALTARTIKGEKERCLKNGMDDYVAKPVILEIMKNAIEKHVFNPSKKSRMNEKAVDKIIAIDG